MQPRHSAPRTRLSLSIHGRLLLAALAAALLALACTGSRPPAPQDASAPAEEAPPRRAELGELAPGEPPTPLPVEADDATWGRADAPVTIVGFIDLQCPFCARAFRTLQDLQQEYGPERLRVVIKHLPLDMHPDALPAAVAAQAVRNLAGDAAFFGYAARVMADPQGIDATSLADHAEEVGVERALYNETVADEATFRAVIHDLELAQRLGITGTPAFYVNGVNVQGAQPIDHFRAIIDQEAQAMAARLQAGSDWKNAYAQRVTENLHTSAANQLLAEDPTTYRAMVDGSPTQGSADALVTLVEFSDFQCPFCKRARPTIAALKKKYGRDLRVVFKHLPLPFHADARPAALLADAVYREVGNEAFWTAVDRLFAAPDLSEESLIELGTELGLSRAQAEAAVRSKESDRLTRDASLAADLEANGTPHFFVNGRRISGAQPLSHFEVFVDAALADAKRLVAAGVERPTVYEHLMRDAATPGVPQKVDVSALNALAAQRPSRGPKDAPVTIHVFSDFECPFCRRAEPTLASLEEQYGDRLRIVWHDLPLPFHKNARPAAHAAREAFAQGGNRAFWKMHAALFALEGEGVSLERESLDEHARRAGLDLARFRKAVDGQQHEAAIAADEAAAAALGLSGTPSFVINGYIVRGAQPPQVFERVIERALADEKNAKEPGTDAKGPAASRD